MKNEAMDQELLEYLYGCHEDPASLEARLAENPDLRARLEVMRAAKDTLDGAAREPVQLDLSPPSATRLPFRFLAAAALIMISLGSWGLNALNRSELHGIEDQFLRLVVSGPQGVPDGARAQLHIATWDLDGEPGAAQISWVARDEAGASLREGLFSTQGSYDLTLPEDLRGVRRVDVRAERAGVVRETSLELAPGGSAPLAHLASDKPVYRPGETAWLRAVVLDRLSLSPEEGWMRLRVVDPKGATVTNLTPKLEEGVAGMVWQVPEDAAGGEYFLELRDSTDSFPLERLPLQVRRFQPPQLAKALYLDRETYAPGDQGQAELHVSRIEGGIPAGAEVDASLVIDGAVVWSKSGQLDERGQARFEFMLPLAVSRGDARFVARVVDGGVTETQVEPFVVPTGSLHAEFYPEGGELVAGIATRVYAEVSDPLDRPASARGVLLDTSGNQVASFETLHQGRARFELTPRAGERYSLLLDGESEAIALPAVVAAGATLRAAADTF